MLLAVSYGPGLEGPRPVVPAPARPATITERFDGWFGSLMKWRRDWTLHNTRVAEEGGRPSRFARWVDPQLVGVGRVIEVGCGAGFDLPVYAAHRRRVLGLDYALPRGAGGHRPAVDPPEFSLDDLRDVLTLGAQLSRRDGEQAVVARHLLESLTPDSTEAFFTFCTMVLRRGGRAYLEGVARTPRDAHAWQTRHESGRIRSLDPAPGGDSGRGVRGAYRLPRRVRRGRASRPAQDLPPHGA